tara:strand:- start:90 stop:515 length:426 start_codon:yes stop_codon:yes gene_type:complete
MNIFVYNNNNNNSILANKRNVYYYYNQNGTSNIYHDIIQELQQAQAVAPVAQNTMTGQNIAQQQQQQQGAAANTLRTVAGVPAGAPVPGRATQVLTPVQQRQPIQISPQRGVKVNQVILLVTLNYIKTYFIQKRQKKFQLK